MATILIDADETLEGLLKPWVKEINRRLGYNVDYTSIKVWDLSTVFTKSTKEQLLEILEDDSFWDEVKPFPGAVKYVNKLHEEGHTILVVTSSHYNTVKSKVEKVILKYFPFLTWHDIIICSNKQLIKGDILVDDYVKNLIGGDYTPILFTSTYNTELDNESLGIRRALNWEDCYNKIHEIIDAK